jgi:ABC-type branched-subunit amino acid transport system permease subunit
LGMKKLLSIRNVGLVLVVIVLLIVPYVTTGYIISLLASIFVAGILAASWNLMSGFVGYVSFGHRYSSE